MALFIISLNEIKLRISSLFDTFERKLKYQTFQFFLDQSNFRLLLKQHFANSFRSLFINEASLMIVLNLIINNSDFINYLTEKNHCTSKKQ
jgi:hypothetical protein